MTGFSSSTKTPRCVAAALMLAGLVCDATAATSAEVVDRTAPPSRPGSAPAGVAASAPPDSPTRAAARRELDAGNAAFEKGAYADALAAYGRAYASVPSPNLLFNLAQTHRNLGHDLDAGRLYQRFLDEAKEAPAGVRREAEEHLRALDARLGRLLVVTTADGAALSHGVELSVDGGRPPEAGEAPPETSTAPRLLRVLPGSHVVAARIAAGAPWSEERVWLRAGELRQVSLALASPATSTVAAPAGAPSSGEERKTTAATTVSAAATLPAAPPAETSPSRWGVSVRADLDPRLGGAGWAGTVTWGLGSQLGLHLGGFVWPAGGHAVGGGALGLRYAPGESAVRPFAELEGLLFGRSDIHLGGRAALGLAIGLWRHLGVSAGAAVYVVSPGAGEQRLISDGTFFSPFVEVALF